MESQPIKLFRGDENSKSTELSSGSFSSNLPDAKDDPKFVKTIPELVSVIFLQYLRDVRILKACRLVSKSWNIYASESLRTCSKVCLREDYTSFDDFTKLLLQRAFGQLQDLPSPFQNFHVEGRSFLDPIFRILISLPNISITSLHLILQMQDPDADPNESLIRMLLTANQTKIENLTITAHQYDPWLDLDFLKSDRINLKSLKSLQIEDHCDGCTHVGWMTSILRMCKPEEIRILFRDNTAMHTLLLEAEIKNLRVFLLNSDISMPSWDYLATVRFSRFRKLTFIVRKLNWPEVFPQWDSICQSVSPLLEELVTNVPISTGSELKFLNLKTMQVSINTALSSLTKEKFPSLENVIVYWEVPSEYTFVEDTPEPHLGVQSLEMTIDMSDFYDLSIHQALMILMTQASRQFPKVTSLTFTISKFDPTTVTVGNIFEVFPKLRKLSLDGSCEFKNISGIDNATIAEYVDRGGSIENIPRQHSITDFIELETIVFGTSFDVDPDMVCYCLPRVPKLREVSLHWNESLSAPVLRDSIGHLERIIILNTSYITFDDEMAEVEEMLPNACIK